MATSIVYGFSLLADSIRPGIQVPWFVVLPMLLLSISTDTLIIAFLITSMF